MYRLIGILSDVIVDPTRKDAVAPGVLGLSWEWIILIGAGVLLAMIVTAVILIVLDKKKGKKRDRK